MSKAVLCYAHVLCARQGFCAHYILWRGLGGGKACPIGKLSAAKRNLAQCNSACSARGTGCGNLDRI